MVRETDVMPGGPFCGTEVSREDDGHALHISRYALEVATGKDRGQVFPIDAGKREVAIGADPDCEVRLDDKAVSWRHATLILKSAAPGANRPVLRDHGSTNGTLVDGTRVIEAYLENGARVTIGRTELVFRDLQEWVHVPALESDRFEGMIGQSAEMRRIFGLLARVAWDPLESTCRHASLSIL